MTWHSAEQIQHIVRRRHLRRSLVTGAVVLAVAGTTVGLSVRDSSSGKQHSAPVAIVPGSSVGERLPGAIQLVGKTTPLTTTDPKATAQVAAANNALAIAMLQHSDLLRDAGGSANVSTSSFSLFVALAMLENGARGSTADGIAKAMQASGLDISAQDVGLAQLVSALTNEAADSHITLETANSLWQQQGFTIKPAFLSTLSTYFHAGVWQTDFANHNAEAVAALNHWTSEKTHGKITKLFDGLDRATVLVLANALYFHAAWQTPFDPNQTGPRRFTTDGKQVTARFMRGPGVGIDTGVYRAASLPYQGGQFEAVAVMPDKGSLTTFVDKLSGVDLTDITNQADKGPAATLNIPRFTTTASMNLVPVLSALGMSTAGDFTGISDVNGLGVDQVVQRVYLGVGEDGTTAAAVTGISMEATSAHAVPKALVFDHPFLFLIRDKVSGAILFASEINDPTAA